MDMDIGPLRAELSRALNATDVGQALEALPREFIEIADGTPRDNGSTTLLHYASHIASMSSGVFEACVKVTRKLDLLDAYDSRGRTALHILAKYEPSNFYRP